MEAGFIYYGAFILCGLVGSAIGAILAGWLVGGRLKKKAGDEAVQRQAAYQQLETTLSRQLDEARKEIVELRSARAALETRIDRIPVLESQLNQAGVTTADLQNELRKESAALARALERGQQLDKVEADRDHKAGQIEALNQQVARCQAEMAELRTIVEEERKQAEEKIALLNSARHQLKAEFQNLAQKIFEEKSLKFTDQNRANMDQIISPLREQLGDFKKRVEDVYDKETRDRTALHAEIMHLKELNQRISKEALNLTRALKGDSKARGNWGEVVLERVLEASGLHKGREYDVQVSLTDERGRRFQPDVIVRLPEGKEVIVDAKVSLTAYERYYSAEDDDQKAAALNDHVDALRTHVRSLAAKRYENLEGIQSLDFVLMFVPIEAAFLAAAEKDRDLFSEAFEKNIMVVSPATLLVTLRTIQNIWRYEYQNRYAIEIAKKSRWLV